MMPYFTADDGVKLFYSDAGEGLPVLALAGLTRNQHDFDHVAPHLPVRLIRPDYRGRGQSDWAVPATYTIAQEMRDALGLMDHLGIDRFAVLGTSRGGMISMGLVAMAKDRLLGVALNDIGPELDQQGLNIIKDYVGRRPKQKTYQEAAAFRAKNWVHFVDVPMERWLTEVTNHYEEIEDGLILRYDPKLRDAVLAAGLEVPDLWPTFDLYQGLPLALIRGINSDLLSKACADEMSRRRPDMIRAEVPNRGHVPFLDEPESLNALQKWLELMS